ncbi:hypothetical protein OHV92_10820 [Acinetobacter baumannii]|nr:hypothetical protein [Acinetobacter baumannii]
MYTLLAKKVQELKNNSQYRDFTTIDRICKQYPLASCLNTNNEVIVWCSNDYLGMSQHQILKEAMHKVIDSHGIGKNTLVSYKLKDIEKQLVIPNEYITVERSKKIEE